MAGQRSHAHNHSSIGHHDQGPSADFAGGVITALGTNSITVKDRHGDTTTFTTTSATTYFEGKTAATVTDLAVNEEVGLELTSTSPQTVTKVEIRLDRFVGAVTTVSGNTITISGRHGTTLNVLVSPTTTYTSGGAASSFAAVVVGSVICAVGLPDATAGTLDASTVNIRAPHLQTFAGGVITALGTNSITVKDRHGDTTTFTTTSATTYFEGKTAATVTDLAVNEEVGLELTSTSPQTVTKVEIRLDRFVGAVTTVSGNTITISGRHGTTLNVLVSPTTTYTSGGAASSFAAVVVGSVICAVGLPDATAGTLDASTVNILAAAGSHHGSAHGHDRGGSSTSHSQGQNHGHGFGRGGFGRGGFGRH